MKIYETSSLAPEDVSHQEREWIYNGLDCAITAEVLQVLLPQLDNATSATYRFARDLQGPCLEMRLRGVLIDQERKWKVIDEYHETLERLESQLEKIVGDGCGLYAFNWRSPRDLHLLFYDTLGIPPVKKAGRPVVDRDALEKLENYFSAGVIVRHLLLMRDLQKKISMLRTEIDNDNRIRTSYNIAGTTTGRLSSSFSEFGTGTNLQNIEESLRSVFVSDPGFKLAYIDAKSGESFCVGAIEWNLFRDGRYLDACETGDIHVAVAQLVWPNIGWTGNYAEDRELADQKFYLDFSRRDACKGVGHASNYIGKPKTISNQFKIPLGLIEDFQPKYFRAFPAHLRWHAWVERELREFGNLTTLTGRKRWFFGRRTDDSTLREAIAYDPQGSLADILNSGMLNVWKNRSCTLLMQIHDAILIQYPEEREDEVIPLVLAQLRYPIRLRDEREFVIPYGVATGWNWGKWDEENNPDGLKSYKPGDKRKRAPKVGILDRSIRSIHGQFRKRGGV